MPIIATKYPGMFSDRLKQLRIERNLKQSEMAKELRVSVQSYSAYENGREPSYETLARISLYFGVSTDYLIGVSDYRKAEHGLTSEKLGLTEQSIAVLESLKSSSGDGYMSYKKYALKAINLLIENESTRNIFEVISSYIWREFEPKNDGIFWDCDETENFMRTHLFMKDKETGENYAISFEDIRKADLIVIQNMLIQYREEYLKQKEGAINGDDPEAGK